MEEEVDLLVDRIAALQQPIITNKPPAGQS
jgi:hypothetical protein